MTRTIKAGEVKPGMEIRWDSGGITYQCKVGGLFPSITSGLVSVEASGGGYIPLSSAQPVTVLTEPQPEEPTEFGARVVVNGRRFLRAPEWRLDGQPWLEKGEGIWRDWDELCSLGPVTVIPDQGWTVPAAPVVPDRIDEWPEDDTALRPYPWRDCNGRVWRYGFIGSAAGWSYDGALSWDKPLPGPWTRETDA